MQSGASFIIEAIVMPKQMNDDEDMDLYLIDA